MPDRRADEPTNADNGRTGPMGLVAEAFDRANDLFRKELDLFRAELQENSNKAFAAVGMIMAGVVLILVALNVLAGALVGWLTAAGIGPGWSALIVFAAFAVIALILIMSGRSSLKAASLAPSRTMKNVRRDANVLREETTHG